MWLYWFLLFFFSSRRRHTRWPRDWSSDVCSSDLVAGSAAGVTALQMDIKIEGINEEIMERALEQAHAARLHILEQMNEVRSEERRVGEEGRARGAPEHGTKETAQQREADRAR